jgi:hypothetical protein
MSFWKTEALAATAAQRGQRLRICVTRSFWNAEELAATPLNVKQRLRICVTQFWNTTD